MHDFKYPPLDAAVPGIGNRPYGLWTLTRAIRKVLYGL